MKIMTLLVAYFFFSFPLYAFDWKANNIAIISPPKSQILSLKNQTEQIFHIQNSQKITAIKAEKIIQLVNLFYHWEFIKIGKLNFLIEEHAIRAIVQPSKLTYMKDNLLTKIPSGLMFFSEDLKLQSEQQNSTILRYNFRIMDKRLFLRIKGIYSDEESLLNEIITALNDSEIRVKEDNPNYLRLKSKQFDVDIKQLKDANQSVIAELKLLRNEAQNLKKQLSFLQDQSSTLKLKAKHLDGQAKHSKKEAKNLRQTIIALNNEHFCFTEKCRKDKIDDVILSPSRYPKNIVKAAQTQLSSIGYPMQEVSGSWDYQTLQTLVRFQKETPLVEVSGDLDQLSQVVLNNPELLALDMQFSLPNKLSHEENTQAILKIQMALLNKGYFIEELNGIWELSSLRALILYQAEQKIVVNGQLDNKTSENLFHYTLGEFVNNLKKPFEPASKISASALNALYIKGYDVEYIDSLWDLQALKATANFQKNENLYISGDLNFETLYYLFDGFNGEFEEPDNYIEKVQLALSNKGFDPGETDGTWGPLTENALKALQKANNLKLSGRIDSLTKEILFPR